MGTSTPERERRPRRAAEQWVCQARAPTGCRLALCPRQHPSFRGCVHAVTATQWKSPSCDLSSARGPLGAQDTCRVSQLCELKLRGGAQHSVFTGPRLGFHCDE